MFELQNKNDDNDQKNEMDRALALLAAASRIPREARPPSVFGRTSFTLPCGSNSALTDDSVDAKSRLPIKIFFMFTSFRLSIVRAI